jgi:uncharacterized protein YccT (UPF0319 family)
MGLLAATLGLGACTSMNGPVRLYEGAERPAAEQALLDVPEVIEVVTIDGHDLPGGLLGTRKLTLEALPGEHVLTLRYVELFADPHMDSHEVVRSHPVALRFTALAGHHYQFSFQQPKDMDAAHVFAKAPAFDLVESGSGARTASMAVKSVAEASLLDTIGNAFHGDDKPAVTITNNLGLLKDVWGRSSPEERAAFRAWLDQGARP